MVCKICGKNLHASVKPETVSAIDEWKEKMSSMSCEELHGEYLLATMSFIHFAAKELLIERGHSELTPTKEPYVTIISEMDVLIERADGKEKPFRLPGADLGVYEKGLTLIIKEPEG